MGKLHIKKRSLAIVMVGIVVSMFVVDGVKRQCLKPSTKNSITDDGSFLSRPSDGTNKTNIISFEQQKAPESGSALGTPGFAGMTFGAADLASGYLAIYSGQQVVPEPEDRRMVDLDYTANDYYTVMDPSIELDADAAAALNKMMADYNTATKLDDFVVYGTTATYTDIGSRCPRYFPESASGYTVDLALAGMGGYISYDGFDEEGWVIQNCSKYGFVVRFPEGKSGVTGQKYCPWHLRYVGKVHASVMAEKNMCLEEYVSFLKGYTKDEPFKHRLGATNYEIYSVPAAGENTEIGVPRRGNYEISGDNNGTFIVTIKK